ncbi:hypothetical protein CK516_29245 [Nostoc sp. 'Peltigera malacea cyanobiont' DB3992]|nr:hypothetical protein CK516_29245 [Nostoc sp. 'Peltigera malacea cyanobiont' DB3992]
MTGEWGVGNGEAGEQGSRGAGGAGEQGEQRGRSCNKFPSAPLPLMPNTTLGEAALLYVRAACRRQTLRVACFPGGVRLRSVTTPTATLRDAVRVRDS